MATTSPNEVIERVADRLVSQSVFTSAQIFPQQNEESQPVYSSSDHYAVIQLENGVVSSDGVLGLPMDTVELECTLVVDVSYRSDYNPNPSAKADELTEGSAEGWWLWLQTMGALHGHALTNSTGSLILCEPIRSFGFESVKVDPGRLNLIRCRFGVVFIVDLS